LAQSQGVDVVVTDHHLPGDTLPAACALVNPNLAGSTFPSPNLAGVGVAYYVLGAIRSKLRSAGHFERSGIEEPRLADWLDLVALGTVADVVPLDRNNRILVHQGLRRIRAGKTRPGIAALIEAARRARSRLTASDLGFGIAPRLNAAGRLRDIAIGIRCLLAEDAAEARRQAFSLSELNDERREIELAMNEDAQLAVETGDAGEGVSICVYEPGWHQGVVGIVAGRLRERYHKPAIAFADAGPTAPLVLKGSARSIPGLHIRDALADCAARYPELIDGFGGHAMAAGLSIRRAALPRFRDAFNDAVAQRVTPRDLAGIVVVDGELAAGDLVLGNAQLIRAHGPWGKDFEEPRFHGEFEVVAQRVVGERHLKLVLKRDERVADAIAFNREPVAAKQVRAVYRLAVNDYGDADTLQLEIDDMDEG
ncbi:MAG: DHHA1 domain-containing protein, partial [Gammaproteobacteria bacterium]|nr:DHHA1 domain-containing protein [Gammaproteobacteria bacterium]